MKTEHKEGINKWSSKKKTAKENPPVTPSEELALNMVTKYKEGTEEVIDYINNLNSEDKSQLSEVIRRLYEVIGIIEQEKMELTNERDNAYRKKYPSDRY